mgnify:CR=1 FL=1
MLKQKVFYGWYLLGIAFLAQMAGSGAIIYSYSIVMLPFGSEFGASRMTMMLGMTALPLAGAVISPILGSAIDRYSLKGFMIAGSLVLPLGFIVLSFTTAIWQVPLIYALFMSFASLTLGPLTASTLLARWFQNRLGLAMGIAAIGTSVGGFLFPPLIGYLIDTLQWRSAFRIIALILFILTFPATLLVVNRPQDGQANTGTDNKSSAKAPIGNSRLPDPIKVTKNCNFWLVAGVVSVLFAVYTALLSNLAPFAIEAGISKEQSALLISMVALCGMIGKLIFGVVADYIDLRLALGTAIILLITGLGFLLGNGYIMLMIGSIAIGCAAGGMLPVWGAILAWLFGAENYGKVMGLMNPAIMPLVMLTPVLTGFIHDKTGSYELAFILFIATLMLSLGFLFAIRKE